MDFLGELWDSQSVNHTVTPMAPPRSAGSALGLKTGPSSVAFFCLGPGSQPRVGPNLDEIYDNLT